MKLITFKNDQGVTYKELKMSGVTSLVIADETAEQLAEGMVISATVTDTTFDDALALCYASRLAAYPDIGQVMEALIKAVVDNDLTQLIAAQNQRAAVKAQFPKPTP